MRNKKLSITFIKSYIPKEYYDGSKLNGISLTTNSYDLFHSNDEFIFRTSIGNPLIKILRETFDVKYNRHFFMHYDEFIITKKSVTNIA